MAGGILRNQWVYSALTAVVSAAEAEASENGVSATVVGIFDCLSKSFVVQNFTSRRIE